MVNAQERYEKFVVPEGQDKLSVEKDSKITNAIKISILCEDHTVGNLVRHQLHRDPEVLFAGYKVPHPLEHKIQFSVKTHEATPPLQCFNNALGHLEAEFDDMIRQLESTNS